MLSHKTFNLEFILSFLIKAFLFLLPWQTIWIYKEQYLNGFKWQYGTLGFYATEILLWVIVLVFMGWSWQRFRQKTLVFKFQITRDRIFTFSILIFIIYTLASSLWAFDSEVAWQHGLRIMEMFLLFFVLYLGPFSFKESVRWLVLGSILPAVLGIFQFVFQDVFASKWLGLANHAGWQAGTSIVSGSDIGRMLRSYGPFAHPNIFGGYLVVVILLSLLWSLSIIKVKLKIVLFASYCLLLTSLFFTFSRSALLALVVSLLIYFVQDKVAIKKRFYRIFYTVLPIIILVLVLVPVLAVRVSGDSVNEIKSITERTNQVGESLPIIKNNLWFGVGAGNYTLALYNNDPSRSGWEYQPVHNVGLLVLSELGLVGLILLLFIILSFFNYNFSFIKRHWVIFVLLLTAYCLLLCFDHYLYSSYIGLVLSAVYWGLLMRFSQQ